MRERLKRPRQPYRRWWRQRSTAWLRYHQEHVVMTRCSWMGVQALKNPLDAWIYQEILHEVQPDTIVELGSAYGGGTLFLAHMLDLLGQGTVISVDWSHARFKAEHPRIVKVTGDTRSTDTISKVTDLCTGRTLVIHDANHEAPVVLEDLNNYSPLVSVGSYLIVEDGIGDLLRMKPLQRVIRGPLTATDQFLKAHPEFEVDMSRERYRLTYNPQGFLRRASA